MANGENNLEPLSVIIPCLNEKHYIGTLLSCLARQTFQNFEVLVIDGSSEDNTREAVERTVSAHSALEHRVRFFVADKKGVSHQRNYGVQLASHSRLAFFDADVQMPDMFLEHTLTEIAKRNLDVATTRFKPLSSRLDDKIIYLIGNVYMQAKQFIRPVAMGFCIFSTKAVHKMAGGFDERLNFAEDADYAERAAKLGASFRVLTGESIFASVRRLDKEGRFAYYAKMLRAEFLAFLNDKTEVANSIDYQFGHYDSATETGPSIKESKE